MGPLEGQVKLPSVKFLGNTDSQTLFSDVVITCYLVWPGPGNFVPYTSVSLGVHSRRKSIDVDAREAKYKESFRDCYFVNGLMEGINLWIAFHM